MRSFITSINPATGQVVGKLAVSSADEIDSIVNQAKKAFQQWRTVSLAKRASYIKKFVILLAKYRDEFARLTTDEMGKPIREAREDVEFELNFIRWYTDHAEEAFGEEFLREDKGAIYKTVYEPWGVCVSIAPWNFPVSMASTGIIPQILAGNTVIFKPSEYTSLTQKKFIDLLNQTGLPHGIVQCAIGAGDVGNMLIESDIDLVWFTGSTKVGQEIYKKCAGKFIKALLELGGSSPAIVFADCDFKKTVDTVFSARFFNCGQVCSSVKRLFVEKPIFDSFIETLIKKVANIHIGNPAGSIDVGPLVSQKQLETLVSQVEDAKMKGATVRIGGMKPVGKEFGDGNYYLPTILTNITSNMRVYKEEVFGPVLPVVPFTSEEEAVILANDTPYGLTAEFFTSNQNRIKRIVSQLHAGGVSINMDIAYAPDCPIGGYKKSGLGREYGLVGMREMAQLKYICIAK